MRQLMIDLYFKKIKCTNCNKQAEPITGLFFADDEIYKVHYFCKHCSQGFEKLYGNIIKNKTYKSNRKSIYDLKK